MKKKRKSSLEPWEVIVYLEHPEKAFIEFVKATEP